MPCSVGAAQRRSNGHAVVGLYRWRVRAGNRAGLVCIGADAKLAVNRSYFAGNDTAIVTSTNCKLSLGDSWLGRGPRASVFGDAPVMSAASTSRAVIFGGEHGLFRQRRFSARWLWRDSHSFAVGRVRRSTVVNSTLYQQSGLLKLGKYFTSVMCDVPVGDRLVLLNTLMLSDKAALTSPEDTTSIRPVARWSATLDQMMRGSMPQTRWCCRWKRCRCAMRRRGSALACDAGFWKVRCCNMAGFR